MHTRTWLTVGMCGLLAGALGARAAGPMPDIKVNGSDGPVVIVTSADKTVVRIAFDPGDLVGTQADWWCMVQTPFPAPLEWYHVLPNGQILPGVKVSHQGPLLALAPATALNQTLPLGTYTIYFGVDTHRNGLLDLSPGVAFYDAVSVKVVREPADYMVIDLSAGPAATSYPVSYLPDAPADGWTDEYKTTKLVLRRIEAGAFTMGSPVDEVGRDGDEIQHPVTLTQPFYIGVFEVTQKQWERVMGTWPSYFNNPGYKDSRPVEIVSYNDIRGSVTGLFWPNSGAVDADSFMGRLRARAGKAFDLPTEAQWEYAGRDGTTTALNSGMDLTGVESCPNLAEAGRYWHNGGSSYDPDVNTSGATAKVGSYLPSLSGLYDIHGNVAEWCLDWYGGYPDLAVDPTGAASGSDRVIRGGGWSGDANVCRSASRGYRYMDNAYVDIGFRIVMPASSAIGQ